MEIINIYKGKEKIISIYANSLEEVKKEPKNYYQEYTEDMYITDQEFSNPTIDSSGELREMTREEKIALGLDVSLEDGEVIKGNKIIKLARPSQYHKWTGKEWSVNLEEVKENKRQELKVLRATKIDEDIVVSGDPFQVKERDLNNFYNIKTIADLNPTIKTQKVIWILADNTAKEFTYEQIMNVLVAYIMRKQELFTKFAILTEKLEQATTLEEIENITWD